MKKIKVPIFGFEVHISNDMDEVIRFIETKVESSSQRQSSIESIESSFGVTVAINGKDDRFYRIMGVFDGDIGTAAHECVHMAWSILEGGSVDIEYGNHEMLAFLTDFLLTQFMKRYDLEVECKKPNGSKRVNAESAELTVQSSLEPIPTKPN